MKRKRRLGSVRAELQKKAVDAALCAIKTFNDPLIRFKSETFIVLMVIAWTYLLHAYYRSAGVEYRYFDQRPKRRRFHRTRHGAIRHWELERCLGDTRCPVDNDTKNNLRFLIGLRHEIEHQMTISLDTYLSGRYQACAMNFNEYIKRLFGARFGLDENLAYSIQFQRLMDSQFDTAETDDDIPARLKAYIVDFDTTLSDEEYDSSRYSYRVWFTRKVVNRRGQADRVIEFIDPSSKQAQALNEGYVAIRDREKDKFRAKDVVEQVRNAGFTKFRVGSEHLRMWKAEDGKNRAKGYGVDVRGTWYWYENWVKRCIELCEAAGDTYR